VFADQLIAVGLAWHPRRYFDLREDDMLVPPQKVTLSPRKPEGQTDPSSSTLRVGHLRRSVTTRVATSGADSDEVGGQRPMMDQLKGEDVIKLTAPSNPESFKRDLHDVRRGRPRGSAAQIRQAGRYAWSDGENRTFDIDTQIPRTTFRERLLKRVAVLHLAHALVKVWRIRH